MEYKKFRSQKFKNSKGAINKKIPKGGEGQKPKPNSSSNNFFIKPSSSGCFPNKVSKDGEGQISKQNSRPNKSDVDNAQQSQKKVFNKRKWRLQKYSLKNKVDEWNNKRMEGIRRGYYREQRKENSKLTKFDVKNICEKEEKSEQDISDQAASSPDEDEFRSNEEGTDKKQKFKRFKKASQECEEKVQSREEYLQMKAEREAAKQNYLKKKAEKNRKLNKKTKRGQPVMKGRLELLLEKIQKSVT